MENKYTEQIKDLMENVYSVADNLDAQGISEHIPFVDPEEGMRGAIRADILLFILRTIDKDKRINGDCLSFLNDCLGFGFTTLTAEMARKKAIETDVPQICFLLPPFILLDKQLGGSKLSTIYVETLAYVTLGYFQCQDHTSLEEMVSYCRYTNTCIGLIEKAFGEKVEFDPLGNVTSEHKELIKCAVEVDKLINKKENDPVIAALEEALIKTINDDDYDDAVVDHPYIEIVKDSGDGTDLLDETAADIIKDESDGSALPDENNVSEVLTLTAMEELESLIGLQEVKQQIKATLNVQRVRKRCQELDIKRPAISMHMVFTGNPGTGKTTVARILGKIYQEAGLLSKGHFVEATRAELVGKYVGHTAVMVKEIFEKAKGGVLFIDEAYALTSEGDSFGQEAVETLLKLMEDNREDIAVIVAGYPMLMQDFLESNPGLRSRFPFVIKFPDYSGDELVRIFKCFCNENDIIPDHSVIRSVKAHFDKETSKKARNYGNAREVRNYFEKMILNQANRLVGNGTLDKDDLCRFETADLPANKILSEIAMKNQGKVLAFNG